KTIASWNLADLNVRSSTRGYEEPKPNQKFGTDIHQHTIEFSKNTRTQLSDWASQYFVGAGFLA
ncbi:hypothetical protein, partial [Nocardia carnea]|uniref:hypothetical protein n=1 Tax=Nocardia carnea TaxID=37328 RepID=UPI002453F07F